MRTFKNRHEAGQKLSEQLQHYADRTNVLVLALPRGGVPVGFEVAKALDAPLDVFVVRKLGVPGREEMAMGAIGSGGTRVLNQDVVRYLGISSQTIEQVASREQAELQRRERVYRDGRPAPKIEDQTVILVDDGLATGASMHAAVEALREANPKHIIVAVPTAPPRTCREFHDVVDEVICIRTPEPFLGVGAWYDEFPQTTDKQVQQLLRDSKQQKGDNGEI